MRCLLYEMDMFNCYAIHLTYEIFIIGMNHYIGKTILFHLKTNWCSMREAKTFYSIQIASRNTYQEPSRRTELHCYP